MINDAVYYKIDIFMIYRYFAKKQLKNASFYYTIKKNYNVIEYGGSIL